jgi:hypothetical protein
MKGNPATPEYACGIGFWIKPEYKCDYDVESYQKNLSVTKWEAGDQNRRVLYGHTRIMPPSQLDLPSCVTQLIATTIQTYKLLNNRIAKSHGGTILETKRTMQCKGSKKRVIGRCRKVR